MRYHFKTGACIENLAHHAQHKFDQTTRNLNAPRPSGRGSITRPSTRTVGLKVEAAVACGDQCRFPLREPSFPLGMYEYDPKSHKLIERFSKYMIFIQEAQVKFREYCDTWGLHDEVYTGGSDIYEREGAAAVINPHFQGGVATNLLLFVQETPA